MTSNIDELRESTFNDLIAKLNAHKKCALIRPCSFGKTVMATRLFSLYQKVLFLYPSDCIPLMLKTRHDDKITEHIKFRSYNKIARMTDEEIANLPDYDLVFADEAHRLGGEKTKNSFFTLMNTQGEHTHFVGSTATPERMDGFDFIKEFFDGIEVEPYSLYDAIRDGVIKKPNYFFCALNPKQEIKKRLQKEFKNKYNYDVSDEFTDEFLSSANIVEAYNIYEVDNIIKNACTQCVSDTSYMKFICFFTRIDDIKENFKQIAHWFESAFPSHTLNKIEIHSGNGSTDIKVLEEKKEKEKEKKNTIDLIFTCDMLNEGYHVGDITGIVMLRKTRSNRVYNQQIGRCLSSNEDDEAKLIIDVVDNLHVESIYNENSILIDYTICGGPGEDDETDTEGTNTSGGTDAGIDDNPPITGPTGTGGRDKGEKGAKTVIDRPVRITGEGWYDNTKLDIYADAVQALYADFMAKAVFEKDKEKIDAAINEYLSREFPKFKSRNELSKGSAARRAILFIAKAYDLNLNNLYAAFELKFAKGG